jgi:hypothetical protein
LGRKGRRSFRSFTGAGLFFPVSKRLCDCRSARYAACRTPRPSRIAYVPGYSILVPLERYQHSTSAQRAQRARQMLQPTCSAGSSRQSYAVDRTCADDSENAVLGRLCATCHVVRCRCNSGAGCPNLERLLRLCVLIFVRAYSRLPELINESATRTQKRHNIDSAVRGARSVGVDLQCDASVGFARVGWVDVPVSAHIHPRTWAGGRHVNGIKRRSTRAQAEARRSSLVHEERGSNARVVRCDQREMRPRQESMCITRYAHSAPF